MSWKDEPASSAQLVTIRDYYARAIGWNEAQEEVLRMKKSGFTKGEASAEITRLQTLKMHGQYTGPKD